MPFTTQEEQRLRTLMNSDVPLLSLAGKQSEIIQELGAQNITTDELQTATSVVDSDKLLGKFDGEDKALTILGLKEALANDRKSTCLVNVVGTGAPHETVVAQLPENITKNSRYVLPNPFGNDTPVICWAEIKPGPEWGDPGFIASQNINTSEVHGWGVRASYLQGIGVVVQAGSFSLMASQGHCGSPISGPSHQVTSAPCRVFIRKLEA